MVADAGQPLDQQRDAVQGPQLSDKPVRRSTGEQGLLDSGELGVRQPGRRAARPLAAQRLRTTVLPTGMPDAHSLGRGAEPASDLGLADADSEQLSRSQPASLELVAFSLCRMAARHGWHAADPHPPSSQAPTRTTHPQPDTQGPVGRAKLPDGELATQPLLQFLGAFIGDGCFNGARGVRLCIPKTDRVRAHYEQLTQSLFTKHADRHYAHPRRRIRDGSTEQMLALRAQGWTQAAIAARFGLSRGSVQDRLRMATRTLASKRSPIVTSESRNGFQFWSTHAVHCLQRYGLVHGAKAKRVPGWVFGLRRELRLALLAGLVDTDGSIDRRGTLKIQLANRPLVEDVKALLVGCGIQTSNLYHQIFDAAVLPNPGRKDQYESWAIVCSSADEVATIPFVDSLYRTRVQTNAGRRRRGGKDAAKAGLDDCLGFYTVRSIMREGTKPVYNLEVDGGHAFIADGLVVQPGHL